MNDSESTPLETSGTELTRFNALRHGVLSRYTVLPWEDPNEYEAIVAALVDEHAPQGPTEEHLLEEIAGILWRKRRLRLAEAAAYRRGLEGTFSPYRDTVKMAVPIANVIRLAGDAESGDPVARCGTPANCCGRCSSGYSDRARHLKPRTWPCVSRSSSSGAPRRRGSASMSSTG